MRATCYRRSRAHVAARRWWARRVARSDPVARSAGCAPPAAPPIGSLPRSSARGGTPSKRPPAAHAHPEGLLVYQPAMGRKNLPLAASSAPRAAAGDISTYAT
jgi:hypothetical protein